MRAPACRNRLQGEGPAQRILAGHHRHHARHLLGRRHVDRDDAGVGVRTAQDRAVQHAGQGDVVDELRPAGEQLSILDALNLLADEPLRRRRQVFDSVGNAHQRASGTGNREPGTMVIAPPFSFRRPSARPPGCSGSRCSGRSGRRDNRRFPRRSGSGLCSSSSVTVITKPGVQKPHCSPWQSWKACWIGWSSRRLGGKPLDGGDLAAGGRAPRASGSCAPARPSTSTVQAPQTPCSQPTWVPGQP
jgi:hypothetical protein